MAITQVSKGGLLLPDGSIRDTREKDVVAVTDPYERQAFARFHEVAGRYGISVVCQRCDCAITGQNNDAPGAVRSVECRCRQWRFVR